ncbi:hypothetical protein [Streptomyces sp. gCLA4]|uniref:hypothetical protein n=1 Tax=Streptomyces sp. gCLA4 TaxID=1873416 RepID=UPI0037DCF8E2
MTRILIMRASSRRPLPVFVLVHGGSSNARAWGPLQNELALLGHLSYAVDLPGHGHLADGPAAYTGSPSTSPPWPPNPPRCTGSRCRTTCGTSWTSCAASPATGRWSWPATASAA